jgi:ribose transport system substrate-binding protein
MTTHPFATGPRRPRRRGRTLALIGTVVAAIGLAACGSSSSSSSSGTSASTSVVQAANVSSGSAAQAYAAATQFLAPHDTAPISWQGPTTPDPVAKNKHIVFIDIAPTNPAVMSVGNATNLLSSKLGWQVTRINVQNQNFSPAVSEAISLHPDGILFNFEDVETDPAAFKALAASHIPVIVFGVSTDPVNSANPGITHIVNVEYPLQGQLTGAAASLLSHGDAHLGIFTLANNSEETDTDNGIASYFKQHGGGSIVATDFFDPSIIFDPAQVGQAAVAFVQAHPSIKQLFVVFDGVAAEVIPALKQAGLGSVQVFSAEGDAHNINLIRTGGGEVGDAVWPYTWATFAAFDDFNRLFDKLPLPKDDGIPVREFYSSDLYSGTGYWDGDYNFQAKYASLWGLG